MALVAARTDSLLMKAGRVICSQSRSHFGGGTAGADPLQLNSL